LIIGDLDVYPQLPRITGAPTLNSEEPYNQMCLLRHGALALDVFGLQRDRAAHRLPECVMGGIPPISRLPRAELSRRNVRHRVRRRERRKPFPQIF
ncbi:hypothetical protein, partial [Brachybacterium paraconglomeratum]|uniref:hypothetical protein n=1 Tax=Brachybacterium paraconglomeratum TaxID=173362 RepID=UPI0022AF3E9E